MRPLELVVKAIKVLVPEDFEKREDLFTAMDESVDSSNYAAPEAKHLWFGAVGAALQEFLGEPDVEWKMEIVEIITDQADYRDYLKDEDIEKG